MLDFEISSMLEPARSLYLDARARSKPGKKPLVPPLLVSVFKLLMTQVYSVILRTSGDLAQDQEASGVIITSSVLFRGLF